MLASSHRHIQVYNSGIYGGRENSTRCNFRKHMQIEKSPADQENIFISLTAGGANAHNTTKYILFAVRFFLFGCVVSICSVCCQIDESCFLNLQAISFFYVQCVSFLVVL